MQSRSLTITLELDDAAASKYIIKVILIMIPGPVAQPGRSIRLITGEGRTHERTWVQIPAGPYFVMFFMLIGESGDG